MAEQPSLGQVVYMLQQIEKTTAEINKNMVRKDVYAEARKADEARMVRLEKDADKASEARTWAKRAVVTSLAFPVLLLVLAVVLNGAMAA